LSSSDIRNVLIDVFNILKKSTKQSALNWSKILHWNNIYIGWTLTYYSSFKLLTIYQILLWNVAVLWNKLLQQLIFYKTRKSELDEPGEYFNLLGGRWDGCDFALEACVWDELDGEVEHQTIRIILCQPVNQGSPSWVLYQFSQPEFRKQIHLKHTAYGVV